MGINIKKFDLKYLFAIYPVSAGYNEIKAIKIYVKKRAKNKLTPPNKFILLCSQDTPIPNIAKPKRYPNTKDSRAASVLDQR